MRCEGVMELMQRCLDEDLTEEEKTCMLEHMKTCDSCAGMFERLNRLSEELVNLPKVTPPYSIVDSILPRLDEIDQQLANSRSPKVSGWQRFRRSFSYRALAGAAAAVVVVVAAASQLPRLFTDHSVSDSAMVSSGSSDARESAGPEERIMFDSSAAVEEHTAEPEVMMDKDPGSDSPDASAPGSADASGTAGNSAADVMARNESKRPASARNDNGGQEETPPSEEQGAGTDSVEPVRDQAVPQGEPGEEKAMSFAEPFTDEPETDGESVQGLSLRLEMTETPGAVTEPVVSPDQAHTAFVEQTEAGLQVVIVDANGERIYASPAKAAESIRNLAWSVNGDTLTYEAVAGERVEQYTIDVRTRSETHK